MDELVMVKEEAEVTDDRPHPIAGLNDMGPPPFLVKIFEMVEDPETDTMVSWSTAENSLIVWDSGKFSTTLLPKYFKHSNFSSFIRQLNTYGFRKVDPDRWEFANEKFLRGQKHLLNEIKRRRNVGQTSQHQNPSGARFDQWSQVTGTPCVEAEQFGVEFEVNRLRRDRKTFIAEIAKLREQHKNSQAQLMAMEERIEGSERMQKNTLSFMARALRNPFFIQQLVLRSRSKKKRSETLQTAEELQIVWEMETLLGSENESVSCSAEEGAAEFEPCGEEMGEMSNVIWELMNNEGLESTRAGGPETNTKAEKFVKG
ncbi:heat stress transcription factor A-2-like isoform X2 [Phalaenopsis equestris]|nr:heat stress transcription factor A-2-like isoform X2 [Phalaenopsis equestris]